MELQSTIINGRKIVALPCLLEVLTKAHEELVAQKIGYRNKLGFVLSEETTGGWRSLALQKQLVTNGASKTLYSNHRRGSAIDCAADWDYIKRIRPTMNKHGLVNDLAYIKGNVTDDDPIAGGVPWDGGHWNYKSNAEAMKFPIIDEQALIKEFSMQDLNETFIQLTEAGVTDSGSFALVIGGHKRVVSSSRLAQALATAHIRGMKFAAVNKATWDGIPAGDNF